jgi:quercetin dioxygenase-like cupin family protein
MKITKFDNVAVSKNPHNIDARKIYDSEYAQAVHMILKPGESLKRHITPVDVFFYVLEGKGIVEIGDEKREVEPDNLIESPANIVHCWYNNSNEILRILVVKIPRPTESTRIL